MAAGPQKRRRKARPEPPVRRWPCRRCGAPAPPCYEFTRPLRCEDCYAEDQARYHGRDQSVPCMIGTREEKPCVR